MRRARRRATADSDVDIFVVLNHKGRAAAKSVEMRLKLRPRFPLDMIVRTPRDVRHRISMGDTFVRDVMEKGKVLYEANHVRMGGKGRR